MSPFITICIPAYKRPFYLKRLLDSIRIQEFRDFEIIVTDDSPDDSVLQVLRSFSELPISYISNTPALGTPANWNKGISLARGQWIKLMHDDDWFVDKSSLGTFAHRAQSTKSVFLFSAYINNFEEPGKLSEIKHLPFGWKNRIVNQPMTLLAYNVIGPPSVTMINANVKDVYTESLKWRVDMEYYIRILTVYKKYEYIDTPLVNVGVSESQVTQSCIYNPAVELPEGLYLLKHHGTDSLRHIFVYDAWWRLLRNLSIRNAETLEFYTSASWPAVIVTMVKHLSNYSDKILKIGVCSKLLMLLSYLFNPYKGKH